jgi:putative ABC transport system permease protein
VVLIFAIFQAIMAQQIDRIGIMKAIGVPYWAIVGTYLSQALLMGLLALLLSLIPTLLFASLLSAWFLNLFNITGLGFQWSAQALWLQIGAALLIPLLATLRPVLQGSRVTVRAALASQGLGAGFQAAPWAIRLSRLLFRSPSRAAAFSNLFRRRERLWLTLTSLTTAGVMFLIVMALISSVNLTLDNEAARQQYDIRFGLAGLHADSELLETVAPILTDEGTGPTGQAQVWYARSASMTLAETRIEDTAGLGMRLIAIELNEAGDTASLYTPAIVAGRWLQPNDNEQYHVVISAETADRNGIELGDAINLDLGVVGSSLFTVVGTYRTVYGGGFVSEPIYIPRQTLLSWLDREPEGTVLLIQANLPTLADAVAMADEAESLLDEAGIVVDPYVTEIKLEERAFADNQFASITSMLLSLAGMAATVGGIGLAGTLSINVLERTREIGILRSLGANDWAIYSSFVLESLLQGILSWLIAVPLAWLAAPALARLMGQTLIDLDLDFRFDWLATGIWLLTILIIAILAALLPARNAARIKVRDSLAYS